MPKKGRRRLRALTVTIPDSGLQHLPVQPYVYTFFQPAPALRTAVVALCLGAKAPKHPCWIAARELLAEGMHESVLAEIWLGMRIMVNCTDAQLQNLSGVPERGVMTPVVRRAAEQGPARASHFRRHDRPLTPQPPRRTYAGVRSLYVLRGRVAGEGGVLCVLDPACAPASDPNNAALLWVSHPTAQGGAMVASTMLDEYNRLHSGGSPVCAARLALFAVDFQGNSQQLSCGAPLVDLQATFAGTAVRSSEFV